MARVPNSLGYYSSIGPETWHSVFRQSKLSFPQS